MKDFRNFSLIIRKLYINNPRLSDSSSDSHFQSNNSKINFSRPSDSPADSHFQSNNSKVKFFFIFPRSSPFFNNIFHRILKRSAFASHSFCIENIVDLITLDLPIKLPKAGKVYLSIIFSAVVST